MQTYIKKTTFVSVLSRNRFWEGKEGCMTQASVRSNLSRVAGYGVLILLLIYQFGMHHAVHPEFVISFCVNHKEIL